MIHSFIHTRLMGLLKWYQSILQAAAWYQGYQHFTFHSAHPWKVFVHLTLDSTETVFNMMTTEVSALPTTTSVTVLAPGMGAQRQWYLYDIIQEFVSDAQKDKPTTNHHCSSPSPVVQIKLPEPHYTNTPVCVHSLETIIIIYQYFDVTTLDELRSMQS